MANKDGRLDSDQQHRTAEQYLQQALSHLRRTEQAGYFVQQQNRARLQTEASLNAKRTRKDYQQWFAKFPEIKN